MHGIHRCGVAGSAIDDRGEHGQTAASTNAYPCVSCLKVVDSKGRDRLLPLAAARDGKRARADELAGVVEDVEYHRRRLPVDLLDQEIGAEMLVLFETDEECFAFAGGEGVGTERPDNALTDCSIPGLVEGPRIDDDRQVGVDPKTAELFGKEKLGDEVGERNGGVWRNRQRSRTAHGERLLIGYEFDDSVRRGGTRVDNGPFGEPERAVGAGDTAGGGSDGLHGAFATVPPGAVFGAAAVGSTGPGGLARVTDLIRADRNNRVDTYGLLGGPCAVVIAHGKADRARTFARERVNRVLINGDGAVVECPLPQDWRTGRVVDASHSFSDFGF